MIQFAIIGGFLGAGKTTAILRLARHHAAAGRRVGIIANDLSEGLVDTEMYLARGLPVEEMAGTCFACRFDELLAAAGRLQDGHRPDVLLAEPAGSCTDIVSRIIEPLRTLYADRFRVAPYVTLLDPQRALTALTGKGSAGFSAKVTYLYKMQQTEADFVAVNKSDTIAAAQRTELARLVALNFPKAEVMLVSARTGEGFDCLAAMLDSGAPPGQNPLSTADLDTALLAEGDTRLIWLNGTWEIASAKAFDADRVLLDLAQTIQTKLAGLKAEPAHVKMTLRSGDRTSLTNIVRSDRAPELSAASGPHITNATLVINARVEGGLGSLKEGIEFAVASVAREAAMRVECVSIREFAPEVDGAACAIRAPI